MRQRQDGRGATASWFRSDITQGVDFLNRAPETGVSAIITNPPYALAQEFIERALHFDHTRIVAMLLRTDFDHAARRAHLFADPMTAMHRRSVPRQGVKI